MVQYLVTSVYPKTEPRNLSVQIDKGVKSYASNVEIVFFILWRACIWFEQAQHVQSS